MRKIIIMVMFLMMLGIVMGDPWVSDPNNCPTEYQSQTCTGSDVVCGYDSGITYCYDPASIVPPSSNGTSNNDYNASFNGGYIINCVSYDGGAPHCDNSGAFWCDRNSTCYSTQQRNTICLANNFGLSNCGTCRTGYYNCYGDIVCEATSTSDCQAGTIPHTRYDTGTCNDQSGGGTCQCDPSYFECDGAIEDGNGCEHLAGSSCGGGTGTKVYDECYDASNANCTSSVNSDCDNSDGDNDITTCNAGNYCEITGGASCGSGTGTYKNSECVAGGGNCTRISDYLDCDDDDGDNNLITCNGGNGCEVDDGGSCSVGALSGTYNGCTCVVDKSFFETGTFTEYATNSSQFAMLWFRNWGSQATINATDVNNVSFIVNTSGAFWNGIDLASGGSPEVDPNWLANYTLHNDTWSSTFNSSYDSHVQDNASWNESHARTIFALIGVGGNSSWNESHANTLYYSITNPWSFTNFTLLSEFTDDLGHVEDNASWNFSVTEARYLQSYTENDPRWTGNYTLHNDTWSTTFNQTYHDKVSFNNTNLAYVNETNNFTQEQYISNSDLFIDNLSTPVAAGSSTNKLWFRTVKYGYNTIANSSMYMNGNGRFILSAFSSFDFITTRNGTGSDTINFFADNLSNRTRNIRVVVYGKGTDSGNSITMAYDSNNGEPGEGSFSVGRGNISFGADQGTISFLPANRGGLIYINGRVLTDDLWLTTGKDVPLNFSITEVNFDNITTSEVISCDADNEKLGTNSKGTIICDSNPTGGSSGLKQIIGGSYTSGTQDYYVHPHGYPGSTAYDAEYGMTIPIDAKIHNLTFYLDTKVAIGLNTCSLKVMKANDCYAGSSFTTILSANIGAGGQMAQNTTGTGTINNGDCITIFYDETGTCTGAFQWSFVMEET